MVDFKKLRVEQKRGEPSPKRFEDRPKDQRPHAVDGYQLNQELADPAYQDALLDYVDEHLFV
jgi:hypothetical protein